MQESLLRLINITGPRRVLIIIIIASSTSNRPSGGGGGVMGSALRVFVTLFYLFLQDMMVIGGTIH